MDFVLSVGGSLISINNNLNTQFLKSFKKLILAQVENGHRFYLVIGGGSIARQYIEKADEITSLSDKNKDWLGIFATRFNASLVRLIFNDQANRYILKSPLEKKDLEKPITILGGWKPGHSTDFVAATLAQEKGIKQIINLSNIDYVYDKDPRKHANASIIKKINWLQFQEIVGHSWKPGLNAPFDPIASKLCEKNNIKVIILNGAKIGNLEKCLNDEVFEGSTIFN